jgi:hypothetical protein
MMINAPAIPLRERLHGLASLLPKMEAPGFVFGTWSGGGEVKPKVYEMSHYDLGEVGETLFNSVYDLGWIRSNFDWGTWMNTEEAIRLRDDHDCLAQATPEQLSKVLTVIIRQERFCDGVLAGAYESGLLVRILRRAADLESQIPEGGTK